MTSSDHSEPMHTTETENTVLTTKEAQDFSSLVTTLGLDEQELRVVLDVHPEDVSQWANGCGTISALTRSRMNEIQSTLSIVSSTTMPEDIPSLLRSPMEMLGNKTPLDLIVEGNASQFRDLVTGMQQGQHL